MLDAREHVTRKTLNNDYQKNVSIGRVKIFGITLIKFYKINIMYFEQSPVPVRRNMTESKTGGWEQSLCHWET